jgi:hypothetical protein
MISCAYCQSLVEDDSFFCDQCGKEIMICTECGRTGQGKCCDEDGSELVSAQLKAAAENTSGSKPTDNLQNNPVIQSRDQDVSTLNPQPLRPPELREGGSTLNPQPSPPALRLINANLGLSLDISNGDIIGRTTGPYSSKLAGFPGISGKHLVFSYELNSGWTFKDIGSSNGTKYYKNNKDWQNIAISGINVPITVENKSYILIANVEFLIQIDGYSNTGTQRL